MPSRSPMVASTLTMKPMPAGELRLRGPGHLALPFGIEQIAIGFRHFARRDQIGVVAERLEIEHLRGPVAVGVLVLGGNVDGGIGLVGFGQAFLHDEGGRRRAVEHIDLHRAGARLFENRAELDRAVAADEIDVDAVFLFERGGERARGIIDKQRRVPGDAPFPLRRIDQRLRCGVAPCSPRSGKRRCRKELLSICVMVGLALPVARQGISGGNIRRPSSPRRMSAMDLTSASGSGP